MLLRRQDDDEHENHEAWVIPYADMLTLLMGLFLVMWAISATNVAELRQVGTGFADQLGIGSAGSTGPAPPGSLEGEPPGALPPFPGTDRAAAPPRDAERFATNDAAHAEQLTELDGIATQIEANLRDTGQLGVKVRMEPRGLVVIMDETVLFGSGSAELAPGAAAAIDTVARPLAEASLPLVVEGHTDDVPISGRYPSNWELSTSRASSVVRHLLDGHGMPRQRISAVGYADTIPVADNATDEGRSANRRVELVLEAPATASAEELDQMVTDGFADPIGDPLAAPTP